MYSPSFLDLAFVTVIVLWLVGSILMLRHDERHGGRLWTSLTEKWRERRAFLLVTTLLMTFPLVMICGARMIALTAAGVFCRRQQ